MGLMRALTLKRASAIPSRSPSILKGRPQISLPTELISTTNNLSYTAPSVKSMQKAAAELSAASLVENTFTSTNDGASQSEMTEPQTPSTPTSASESRRGSHLSEGSEPSLTDASSVSSFSSPNSPDPHHLLANRTSYFVTDTFTKPSSNSSTSLLLEEMVDPLTSVVPALPRRAPSHSKREHERLARRRSQRVSHLQLSNTVIQPLASPAETDDVFSPAPLSSVMPGLVEVDEEPSATVGLVVPQVLIHEPEISGLAQDDQYISQELKQRVSVVERMSISIDDEDSRVMRELGLKKWSVSGYLDVVADPWASEALLFDDVALVA